MKIEVIICCERGYLEGMAKLLVYSIRNFGGVIKNAPIYSYRPREGDELSDSTLAFFKDNDVHYIPEVLNTAYTDYPLANKPLSCAHRERHSDADTLVFIDTDTFFLQSPDEFVSIQDGEVMLRPVDRRNIGTTPKFEGQKGRYWKEMYEMFGVERLNTIKTTVGNNEIVEYYNSGLIVTKRANGLFAKWKENFERVMQRGIKPKGMFFVEQSVFSATVAALDLNVVPFSKEYNCPVHNIEQSQNPNYQIKSMQQVVHAHYHKMFRNISGVNPLYNEFEKFANGRIINLKIEEYGVIVKISKVRYYLSRTKRLVTKSLKSLMQKRAKSAPVGKV